MYFIVSKQKLNKKSTFITNHRTFRSLYIYIITLYHKFNLIISITNVNILAFSVPSIPQLFAICLNIICVMHCCSQLLKPTSLGEFWETLWVFFPNPIYYFVSKLYKTQSLQKLRPYHII